MNIKASGSPVSRAAQSLGPKGNKCTLEITHLLGKGARPHSHRPQCMSHRKAQSSRGTQCTSHREARSIRGTHGSALLGACDFTQRQSALCREDPDFQGLCSLKSQAP